MTLRHWVSLSPGIMFTGKVGIRLPHGRASCPGNAEYSATWLKKPHDLLRPIRFA